MEKNHILDLLFNNRLKKRKR